MRVPISLLFVAFGLAACAGRRIDAAYGNFIPVPETFDGKVIADDVAGKLAVLYPPARTSIRMRQATPDKFGIILTAALRGKGYALGEFDPTSRTTSSGSSSPVKPPEPGSLALAYLLDQPLEAGFYRVTVLMNEQSLSRLYQAKAGSLVPAGYWVRKE